MAIERYKYKDEDGQGSMTAAYDRNGNRRGFVARDKSPIGYTRYGVGIDEMGPYDRGYYEGQRNMPIGDLDYGYDGDTVYAGFTPNVYSGENEYAKWGGIGTLDGNRVGYYQNADGKRDMFANLGDVTARAGRNRDNAYYGLLALPDSARTFNAEGSFNTPLGEVNYGPVVDAPGIYADFTPRPTNYYIQALANLLRGK
jgi:hypothetical protein